MRWLERKSFPGLKGKANREVEYKKLMTVLYRRVFFMKDMSYSGIDYNPLSFVVESRSYFKKRTTLVHLVDFILSAIYHRRWGFSLPAVHSI